MKKIFILVLIILLINPVEAHLRNPPHCYCRDSWGDFAWIGGEGCWGEVIKDKWFCVDPEQRKKEIEEKRKLICENGLSFWELIIYGPDVCRGQKK